MVAAAVAATAAAAAADFRLELGDGLPGLVVSARQLRGDADAALLDVVSRVTVKFGVMADAVVVGSQQIIVELVRGEL